MRKGPCQRSKLSFVLQTQTAITPGVMVWVTISPDNRSPLVILNTTLTAQWRVADHFFYPSLYVMGIFSSKIMPDPIRLRISLYCLHTWSENSTSLSPIEHIWLHIQAPQVVSNLEAITEEMPGGVYHRM